LFLAALDDLEGIGIRDMRVPKVHKSKIFRQLFDLGINHGTLFGDPDSIAKSIKYRYSEDYEKAD
jgi:hypothetical protein